MAVVQQPAAPVTYISFSADINQMTAEGLLAVCADLANRGVQTVYLMLSSPGGSVMYGLNLYNVLRTMPFKLITHNVGNVDSIANVVFLAGEERYSCPHSTFMFHGVGFDVMTPTRFEEKFLRERMDSVVADQGRIKNILTERTQIQADEAGQLFLEAVTKDPDFAKSKGIVHDIRDVKIPAGTPLFQLVFKR